MSRYLNKLFTASALALLFPACVSAASFFPTSNIDINLTEDTTYNYESYTISSGINVSYTAPENSFVDIFITNDMFIDGSLSFFGGATYSLTFDTGTITENASINLDSGTLNINAIGSLNINSNINSGTGSTGSGVTLSGNGGTVTGGSSGSGSGATGGGVTLSGNGGTVTAGSAGSGSVSTGSGVTLSGSGGTITGGSTGTGTFTIDPVIFTPPPTITGVTITLQLTPVPVPPSLLLFLTGLGTLAFGFKRSSH